MTENLNLRVNLVRELFLLFVKVLEQVRHLYLTVVLVTTLPRLGTVRFMVW